MEKKSWIFTVYFYSLLLLVLLGFCSPVNAQSTTSPIKSCSPVQSWMPQLGQPAGSSNGIPQFVTSANTTPAATDCIYNFCITNGTCGQYRLFYILTCSLPYNLSGSICVLPPGSDACLPKQGKPACDGTCIQFFKPPAKASGGSTCDANCSTLGNLTETGLLPDGSGYAVYTGSIYSGSSCVSDENGTGATSSPGTTITAPQPVPNSERPPAGKCPGEVNGNPVFINCSSISSTSTSSTSSEGATTSTTSTTTCNNGKCTTTTSGQGSGTAPRIVDPSVDCVNPPAVYTTPVEITAWRADCYRSIPTTTQYTSTIPTVTTTESQDDFCKKNPKDKRCKEGTDSSFTGTCETKFTCDGDAALCAAARGANETKCALDPLQGSDSAASASGREIAKGNGITVNPTKNPTIVNLGTFNKSNPFTNSCPADIPLQYLTASVVIPLSSMCGTFQLMGNVLVLVTTICCAAWFRT